MKKVFSALIGAALAVTLAACGGDSTPTSDATETIYVLGPTPDHGWTAQAGTFAERRVKEIAEEGKYKAQYLPASSGEAQNDIVSTIIANGDAAGVVFMALDDSAKSGQEALIAAEIPFISFDRIIEGPDASAILNFSGNNWDVGAGIAYWLQSKGMKPGDTLVTLIGDNGTVSSRRQEGFEQFLMGDREYTDSQTKQTASTTQVWTQEEVDALTASYKVVCDWSADKAYGYLEASMGDIINSAQGAGGNLYVFSMDDEMTFGVMNLLEGNTLSAEQKQTIEDMNVYISAIGGMQELYDVIAGTATQSAISQQYFDDIMSMYFSPKMMITAVDYMVEYLSLDSWPYEVGSGEYEPTFIVDATNAATTEGFTGHA
ncbi:MAG: substrate-binding domain-containing protein [Propionibacteriaceae bacterium]|nr:substrate-binding domain-containing protein [Propionibacteriaceae bacterium]